jgi:CCR4-NOT transcription complex subunit 10
MLGHLYCAEALIMLDRVKDAMVYLEPKFINELKPDDFFTADWNVNSLEAAQSVLAYNLAVSLAISGEYELAKSPMSICKHPIVFNRLKMLEVYLEMQCGNIENCKKLIKKDTPQFAY